MKIIVLILIGLHSLTHLAAQPYTQAKTRHRFAQMNFGADFRSYVSNGAHLSYTDGIGQHQRIPLGDQYETRLLFGGTHFWGHADFQVAIPVASFGGSGFKTGVETSAKYYPWRIQHNKLRPFIGFSWLPAFFQYGGGVKQWRHKYPLLAGAAFNSGKHLIELTAGYNYNNRYDYYVSPTDRADVQTQNMFVTLGYKMMLETTLSAETNWQNGRTKWLTDTLTKLKRLNGFTVAIGPSTAMFLRRSAHNEAKPFLDDHKTTGVFADAGIGYYFNKPDLHINLAFRTYKNTISAFGHTQTLNRLSFALEGYKFFADYHGFAPFIGPALSYERLKVKETDPVNLTTTTSQQGVHPGLTFGWDIRPNKLQFFYLRTNLRYFPTLHVDMPSGKQVSFNNLEVNFIQFVLFPGRMF